MKTTNHNSRRALNRLSYLVALVTLAASTSVPASGQEIIKTNNTDYLNLGSSWVGGVAPGAGNVAVWDSTVTSANTSEISDNWAVGGIKIANPGGVIGIGAVTLNSGLVAADNATDTFSYSGADVINGAVVSFTNSAGGSIPGGLSAQQIYFIVNVDAVNKTFQISDSDGGAPINFTSNGGNLYQNARPALTLGSSGIDMSAATRNLTLFTAPVILSASQTWTVATGRNLDSNNNANNAGLAVINSGHTLTFDGGGTIDIGQLHGSGGIVKDGAGRVNLHAGQYTYTGDVVLNAGSLNAGSTLGALGSGDSTLTMNGGTLTFAANVARDYARNTTIGGDVAIYNNNSAGNGAQSYTFGTLSVGSNTVTVTANGSNEGNIIFGATTLTGNPVFDIGSRTNNQFQLGAISEFGGSRSLTKTGVGTLILNGNNTYTGETDIQAGKLRLGIDGTLAGTSRINIHSGARLDVSLLTNGLTLANSQILSGSGEVEGDLTAGSGSILSPGNSIGTLTVGNLTLAGGSIINWEFINDTTAGTTYDQIAGNGSLILPESGWVRLNVLGVTGHSVNLGDSFLLYDGAVDNFNAERFEIVNSSDWSGAWEVTGSGGLTLTAIVPEPSTALLCLIGGLALAMRRQRKV